MPAPFVLDKSAMTSGKLPDGRTVPLAWNLSNGEILMKTHESMPWGDDKALADIESAGGQYVNDGSAWFRGVWSPAPPQVFNADYKPSDQSV